MYLRLIPIAFAISSFFCTPLSIAYVKASDDSFKVLNNKDRGYSLITVKAFLEKGDDALREKNISKARENYDKARVISKQLYKFYRDISGSFRGLDVEIPIEMDKKGRDAQVKLAEANIRLAQLFRQIDQPEVAVPLLVEVVKIMTPVKPQGAKAYKILNEIGFAENAYQGY